MSFTVSPASRAPHARLGRVASSLARARGNPTSRRRAPTTRASSSSSSSSEKKTRSDEEYARLKSELTATTVTHSAALSAYCLLGYGVAPGLSAALGGVGAVGYLTLLQRYVDNVSEREADGNISEMDYTRNLVYEPVTDVGAMLGGAFEKVTGVYSRALLQKRLLVPVALVVVTSTWNHLDLPFDFSYGATFCGFLCYKTAVLSKSWEILKPLLMTPDESSSSSSS